MALLHLLACKQDVSNDAASPQAKEADDAGPLPSCELVDGACGPATETTACCKAIEAKRVHLDRGCREARAVPFQCGGRFRNDNTSEDGCVNTFLAVCYHAVDDSTAYLLPSSLGQGPPPGFRNCSEEEARAVDESERVICTEP